MTSFIMKAQSAWPSLQYGAWKFMCARSGATAVEYGLIAAGIVLTIIAAAFALGEEIGSFFNSVGEGLNEKQPS